MIFNLRGTNGSGKSYVAHNLIGKSKASPFAWRGKRNKVEAYKGTLHGKPLVILGSYATMCGGMDTITDIIQAAEIIVRYCDKHPIVFYEGLFISHCLGTVGAATKKYGNRLVMAYLDTPLEVCLQRVHARRAERGNTKPFKEQNVIDDYQRVEWNYAKAKREGFNVVDIDHTKALEQTLKYLKRGAK
jgi:hypothetical protein